MPCTPMTSKLPDIQQEHTKPCYDVVNIQWSEYAHHIWCFDCEKDVKGTEGIFGGPIGINCATVLGMSFDKWDLINKKIIRFDPDKQESKTLTS